MIGIWMCLLCLFLSVIPAKSAFTNHDFNSILIFFITILCAIINLILGIMTIRVNGGIKCFHIKTKGLPVGQTLPISTMRGVIHRLVGRIIFAIVRRKHK